MQRILYGINIDRLKQSAEFSLPEWYKLKMQHLDAFRVLDSLTAYPQFPETFDGRTSAEVLGGRRSQVRAGEVCHLPGSGISADEMGYVVSVAVSEVSGEISCIVIADTGSQVLIRRRMSSDESRDYGIYGDAYFGEKDSGFRSKDIFKVFEWLVDTYKHMTRAEVFAMISNHPDLETFKEMDTLDILLEICAGWADSIVKDLQEG